MAGLRAAETLRQKGFAGSVTVVGAEPHRPYDRPPLSKKLLLGEWEPDRIQLRQPDSFDDLDVEWKFGIAASRLRLADQQIPLEVSPTSNVRTRSVASIEAHPLPQLVAAGVPVSINSDDPPMFGTTLNTEYQVAADLLGLDQAGVADLARAAVRHSFADDAVKTRILDEIDAYAG